MAVFYKMVQSTFGGLAACPTARFPMSAANCDPAMSDTETTAPSVVDRDSPPLILIDDATSDTEVEPPSPNGSTKAMYVRSRPTSMDVFADGTNASMEGTMLEFPAFAPDLDFTRFGMTSASPVVPLFPPPPVISLPPVGKRRRYAASMKSLYTGTGTGTSLKTNQAPIIPVKAVLRQEPATPVPAKSSGGAWKVLRKIVPGLFPRPAMRALKPLEPNNANDSQKTTTATRGRAFSIRSFKSTKSKGKVRALGLGIENIPIPPVPVRAPTSSRTRVHSFSGYLADSELEIADDEDETDPEMTAIHLEALRTVLKLNQRYEYAVVDPEEIGVAL
ncbi:hypothetical protein MVEN_00492400 [Mycena venus]|uniref:Uncharacterized protein n=1 Tax=Mycena venus TaxID=2733690 RepID=A0A8H6YYH9_9AGAR|nr:hypothetical protein MVEN_00492400 [Mycena venus]